MNKLQKHIILLILFTTFTYMVFAIENLIINETFFLKLNQIPKIHRDIEINKIKNKNISVTSKIISIEKSTKYKKNFQIYTIQHYDNINLTLYYYIYTNSTSLTKSFIKHRPFTFTGNAVVITPLNTQKNAYAIDVLLKQGTLVIE